MNESTQSIHAALLPFLGVLRLQGPDAATFLQGQVTHDTRLLADGRTLLAACNTPQGRVIALLRLRQTEDAVYALLPVDLLEQLAARLRRFVLRAKVDVQVATDLQVAWVGSQPFSETLAVESYDATRTVSAIPQSGATEIVSFDYAPGRQVVAAPGMALRAMTGLSLTRSLPGIENEWRAADIAAGLPQVFRASSEAWVPQMLNLDLLDGISFSKGCYTGQEIVARTQNLGRIKRRMFRYAATGARLPLPGDKLVDPGGAHAGDVVCAATGGPGVDLLAVVSLELAQGPLRLEADPQRTLTSLPLPYPLA